MWTPADEGADEASDSLGSPGTFETCGRGGPVRVLEHADDDATWVRQWGDRLLVQLAPPGNPTWATAWSVGSCGESPTKIADDLTVYPIGEMLVGCGPPFETADLLRLDPEGRAEPVVLFPQVPCAPWVTEHGWLAFDPEQGVLLQVDPTLEAPAWEVVATQLLDHSGHCPVYGAPGCDPAEVVRGPATYAIGAGQLLLRIDLSTHDASVVEGGAAWAWLEPEGTRLWWKEAPAVADDPASPVHLRDLVGGTDIVVYDGDIPFSRNWPYALATLRGDADASLLDLRSGSVFALPPGVIDLDKFPDWPLLLFAGDWMAERSWVWSEAESLAISLPDTVGCSWRRHWAQDGLDVIEPVDCDVDGGDLWTYPYDGGEPRLVMRDVDGPFLRFEDRVVWTAVPLGMEEPLRGELYVGIGEERQLIDVDALLQASPPKDLGTDVLYSVFDGERSGLWRTATR